MSLPLPTCWPYSLSHFSVILIARRNTAHASLWSPLATSILRQESNERARLLTSWNSEARLNFAGSIGNMGDKSTVLVHLLPATTTATNIFIWIQISTWRSCPVRLSPVGP
jgi:hypothetical protein